MTSSVFWLAPPTRCCPAPRTPRAATHPTTRTHPKTIWCTLPRRRSRQRRSAKVLGQFNVVPGTQNKIRQRRPAADPHRKQLCAHRNPQGGRGCAKKKNGARRKHHAAFLWVSRGCRLAIACGSLGNRLGSLVARLGLMRSRCGLAWVSACCVLAGMLGARLHLRLGDFAQLRAQDEEERILGHLGSCILDLMIAGFKFKSWI